MPIVSFTSLPDPSRVWVFGAERPLDALAEEALLTAVDRYLATWKAHGAPLTVSRDWREHRFLTIAVDSSQTNASGCSIDGLFRELKRLEDQIGIQLIGSGAVYYRDENGEIQCTDREGWTTLAEQGLVTRETPVFDFTVTTLGDWRARFETTAGQSWHGTLLPALR
jgi:hypothetical protein